MASNTPPEGSPLPPQEPNEEMKKFGTHIMGEPAAPTSHPDNQMAASWSAGNGDQHPDQFNNHQPYVVYSPVDKPTDPVHSVIHMFNNWSSKAETIGRNIWHNLRTGPSVSEAALGKLNLTAKAISGGGFESLYKQIFGTESNDEKLKKTFACYLSTTKNG